MEHIYMLMIFIRNKCSGLYNILFVETYEWRHRSSIGGDSLLITDERTSDFTLFGRILPLLSHPLLHFIIRFLSSHLKV